MRTTSMASALNLMLHTTDKQAARTAVNEAMKLEAQRDRLMRVRRGVVARIVERGTGHNDLRIVDRDLRDLEQRITNTLSVR